MEGECSLGGWIAGRVDGLGGGNLSQREERRFEESGGLRVKVPTCCLNLQAVSFHPCLPLCSLYSSSNFPFLNPADKISEWKPFD